METILYLLVIFLPVIFKLIGKNLEKSGNVEKAKKFQQLAQEVFSEEDETLSGKEFNFPFPAQAPVQAPEPVTPERVAQMIKAEKDEIEWQETLKRQSLRRPATANKPISPVVEEVTDKPRERIDPKKLVVYSEIMKTKF